MNKYEEAVDEILKGKSEDYLKGYYYGALDIIERFTDFADQMELDRYALLRVLKRKAIL